MIYTTYSERSGLIGLFRSDRVLSVHHFDKCMPFILVDDACLYLAMSAKDFAQLALGDTFEKLVTCIVPNSCGPDLRHPSHKQSPTQYYNNC